MPSEWLSCWILRRAHETRGTDQQYGFEAESLVLGDEKKVEEYLNAAHVALAKIIENLEAFYAVLQVDQPPRENTVTDVKAIIEFAASAPASLKCDLAANVFQAGERELVDKVRTFQQLVHRYRETALAAETVISDPSAISAGDAEALGRQLDRLLEWEITTIDQSLAERLSGTCSKLLNRLQEYDNHAKSELRASFADLHTLKDLDRIEAVYTLLKSKPEEIDGIDKSQLFSSSIRPFATGLLEEAERLVCERDGLSSVFAINDVCGLEELSALRKVFRQSQGRFLRSFGKEYRKAKDVLRSFAKDESIVNNRALSELLERLECFMRDERSFSQHTTYCKILGDMFKGLDTDWDRLRSVLAWTADFIEVAGPEVVKSNETVPSLN